MTTPTIHFAGLPVRIGSRLRQRCAWCDHVLADYDLTRLAAPEGQDPTPATWQAGSLVRVEGTSPRVTTLVPHEDGDQLPAGTCADGG
ncbi:hypothetical protein [Actinophytocola sediminis]